MGMQGKTIFEDSPQKIVLSSDEKDNEEEEKTTKHCYDRNVTPTIMD